MNPQKFFRATLYCLLLFTVSCASGLSATPNNIVRVPISTLAPTTIPSTLTPTSTSTPLPTITPLPTATHLPTLTPLPTLAPDKAEALIEELLYTNAGCRLPCWWGITPGKTKWEEAERFLKTLAIKFEIYSDVSTRVKFKTPSRIRYTPDFEQIYSVEGKGDIVTRIFADPLNSPKFSLSGILASYGKPDEIYLHVYPARRERELPFRVVLFYSTEGIIASYYFADADKNGEKQIRSCLKEDRFFSRRLHLFHITTPTVYSESLMYEIELGGLPFAPLNEVTKMSVDDFYSIYKNPNYTTCLDAKPTY